MGGSRREQTKEIQVIYTAMRETFPFPTKITEIGQAVRRKMIKKLLMDENIS